jgi:hypothetical protein
MTNSRSLAARPHTQASGPRRGGAGAAPRQLKFKQFVNKNLWQYRFFVCTIYLVLKWILGVATRSGKMVQPLGDFFARKLRVPEKSTS